MAGIAAFFNHVVESQNGKNPVLCSFRESFCVRSIHFLMSCVSRICFREARTARWLTAMYECIHLYWFYSRSFSKLHSRGIRIRKWREARRVCLSRQTWKHRWQLCCAIQICSPKLNDETSERISFIHSSVHDLHTQKEPLEMTGLAVELFSRQELRASRNTYR